MVNDILTELGAFDLRGPLHQSGEVISHPFTSNGSLKAFEDEVGRLVPSHVAEHHLAT